MDPSSSGNPPNLSSNSPHPPIVPFPSFGQQCNKTYTKRDMNLALEALRSKKLSLSRASEIYGIPPTTLWQRANRMGIPTPKKETSTKSWTDEDLQRYCSNYDDGPSPLLSTFLFSVPWKHWERKKYLQTKRPRFTRFQAQHSTRLQGRKE